jgi:hypothetical protein
VQIIPLFTDMLRTERFVSFARSLQILFMMNHQNWSIPSLQSVNVARTNFSKGAIDFLRVKGGQNQKEMDFKIIISVICVFAVPVGALVGPK